MPDGTTILDKIKELIRRFQAGEISREEMEEFIRIVGGVAAGEMFPGLLKVGAGIGKGIGGATYPVPGISAPGIAPWALPFGALINAPINRRAIEEAVHPALSMFPHPTDTLQSTSINDEVIQFGGAGALPGPTPTPQQALWANQGSTLHPTMSQVGYQQHEAWRLAQKAVLPLTKKRIESKKKTIRRSGRVRRAR